MAILPKKLTKAQQCYIKIADLADREVRQTNLVLGQTHALFWAGGAAAAQEICDIAGQDAALMFAKQSCKLGVNKAVQLLDTLSEQPPEVQAAVGGILQAARALVDLSPEFAPPHTVTANADGTVTITEKLAPEPEVE